MQKISPEYVLNLRSPTINYLCEPKDNIYDVKFLNFKLRDFINNE